MAKVTDRKSALMWAVGWWFFRRWLRRRAALAMSEVAASASARRGRLRAVLAATALVAALAGALFAWRRLASGPDDGGWDGPPPDEPVEPTPTPTPEAVAV
jgi:hypothetical protein